MKRVVIIGSPGSGKSTFAAALSKKTGLPVIHLDYYYHQKDKNYQSDSKAWRKKVGELIKNDKWIMDGNYASSYDLRLPAAKTIILFNFPRYIAMWQVIKRRVKYHNKPRSDMPDTWKEKADWEFIRYVWGFKKKYDSDIRSILESYKDKEVFIFNSKGEAKIFLARIT